MKVLLPGLLIYEMKKRGGIKMKEEETIVLETFLEHVNKGRPVRADSPMQQYMTKMAFEAMKITFELNSSFHTPEEIRKLFFQLTGQPEEETFRMFPPFTTDCGKNIRVGKNVFINSGCRFQDQGGITLGDETLVGHNVVFATLNHGVAPEDRGTTYPKPIRTGKKVWIGANATILPGVTIGDHAIVAAGGNAPKGVRPPGGKINDASKAVLAKAGMPSIVWSVDTLDWKTRNAQHTIDTVLRQVQDGDIILMHDLYEQSVIAAETLIPELTRRGYQLVTVSEMAELRGGMAAGQSYGHFR